MMQSLRFKWSVSLIITSLVGIVLVGLLATQINSNEYQRFRDEELETLIVELASEHYLETGSFEGLDRELVGSAFRRKPRSDDSRGPAPFVIVDNVGAVISPLGNFKDDELITRDDITNGIAIYAEGEQVGTLILTAEQRFDEAELRFLQRTNNTLMVAGIGAVVVAVILGLFLSQQFLRPLAELTEAIGSIQQGKFDQRVPVRTNDELGELAQAFNQMGEELQHVNQLRRQMTADIAHDLRTPLTVISGYLEGLRDGSLKPTQARFDTLYQESQLLKRLIDDLRTLSLADAGELNLNLQDFTPNDLLAQVLTSFRPLAESQGVQLTVSADDNLSKVTLDRDRMLQVLGNLVSNSLRYTPAGGQITLSAKINQHKLILSVQDTGSGIAPEHLQNIFARFYRVGESRHQNEQESGLGLAIAKSIVTAHGGQISAESQIGQGTTIILILPIE